MIQFFQKLFGLRRPMMIITHPGVLSKEAYENLRDQVRAELQQPEGNPIIILEEGMKAELVWIPRKRA